MAAWEVSPPSSVIIAAAFLIWDIISISVEVVTIISPSFISFWASSNTLAVPDTFEYPTPKPFTKFFVTTWTLRRLVVPDCPTGTPAVITTKSPIDIKSFPKESWTEVSITSSVVLKSLFKRGYTPQIRDICLYVIGSLVVAITGAIGL